MHSTHPSKTVLLVTLLLPGLVAGSTKPPTLSASARPSLTSNSGGAGARSPVQTEPERILPAGFCDAVSEIPAPECEALVALYSGTNGAAWTTDTDWLVTTTPCSWYGVTCAAGHVTELDLEDNNLSGPLPAELGNLGELRDLNLYTNHLTGAIPTSLGSLSNLVILGLDVNGLSGEIPAFLGSLSTLQVIALGWNGLSGNIPAALGDLTNLNVLDLIGNNLTGNIPPELGNLSQLRQLNLSGNGFDSPIPATLGDLTDLRLLNLQLCGMTGSIPPELGALTNLEILLLGPNQLTGTIPEELGDLTSLRELALLENHLSGEIPPSLGNLANLERMHLGSNNLTGAIPAELGNLTNLKTLYLDGNALSGAIPSSLTNLVNLVNDHVWMWYFELDGAANLGYNMLTATDPALLAFLAEKDPLWDDTQTVPPTNLQITQVHSTSAMLSWSPIAYIQDGGYYEVFYSANSGGPYTLHGHTASKAAIDYTVDGLLPGSTYYFKVRTHTPAHGDRYQPNDLWSDLTSAVSATTEMTGLQTILDETTGDTLTYTAPSGDVVTVDFPVGAVTETTTMAYIPLSEPAFPSGFSFGGHAFELNAYDESIILEGFSFVQPVTITLEYDESSLGGLDEESLLLMYWDESLSQWIDGACGPYDRHPADDWLSVPICHLSEFALVIPPTFSIYLPLISR